MIPFRFLGFLLLTQTHHLCLTLNEPINKRFELKLELFKLPDSLLSIVIIVLFEIFFRS